MKQLNASKELAKRLSMIEALEGVELKQWLHNRLSGRDRILSDTIDNSTAYPLIAVFANLNRNIRDEIRSAAASLLEDLTLTNQAAYDGADDLLVLCQTLMPEKAGCKLRHLVESSRIEKFPRELQVRILQTIVALHEKLSESTWLDQFRRLGDCVAGIAFEGVSSNSVTKGVEFLANLKSPAAIEQVALHLPAFVERVIDGGAHAEFASAFRKFEKSFILELQEQLLFCCRQLGLAIPRVVSQSWLGSQFDPRILLTVNYSGGTQMSSQKIKLAAL
jgi:hypothetical protein